MVENDIYNNKMMYERLKANLRGLLVPPEAHKGGIGSRKYWIKNPANLAYFDNLFKHCEAKDLSYIRRVRVASVLLFICHYTSKDLAQLDRDAINAIVTEMHKVYISCQSKSDFIKNLKCIWKLLFPEKDGNGRVDDSIMPYAVRHLSCKVDKSRQKLRNDRITFEEFTKLVNFFSKDPRMQAYLTFALESLGRPQEILYTKLKNVELHDNYAKVWISEHGKEGVGFLQCIDSYPYLAKWLSQHPYKHNKDSYLFVNLDHRNGGVQLNPLNINITLKRACKKLGIDKPVTCYSLKRNGVTMRRLRGDTDVQIQHAARWTSTRQLKTYDMSRQEDAFKLELIKRGMLKPDKETEHLAPATKECLFCSQKAGFNEDTCPNCKRPLDREKIRQMEQEKEGKATEQIKVLQGRLEAIEEFMNKLVQNERARNGMIEGIKVNKLQNRLRELDA